MSSSLNGPVRDVVSRTGPPVRLQWERGSDVARICDPPVPVLVSMRAVDPGAGQPDYSSNGSHPSLRVRAAGIRFEPVESGYLLAWIRLADGQWRAIVSVELRSANQRSSLQTTLYVAGEAVRKREENDDDR